MRPSFVAIVALGAVCVTAACVIAETTEATAPAAGTAAVVKSQTTCPVMKGNPVNKTLFVDYEGKRIYVCCADCIKEITANPAKYVKQLEAEGITLDKVPAPAAAATK